MRGITLGKLETSDSKSTENLIFCDIPSLFPAKGRSHVLAIHPPLFGGPVRYMFGGAYTPVYASHDQQNPHAEFRDPTLTARISQTHPFVFLWDSTVRDRTLPSGAISPDYQYTGQTAPRLPVPAYQRPDNRPDPLARCQGQSWVYLDRHAEWPQQI